MIHTNVTNLTKPKILMFKNVPWLQSTCKVPAPCITISFWQQTILSDAKRKIPHIHLFISTPTPKCHIYMLHCWSIYPPTNKEFSKKLLRLSASHLREDGTHQIDFFQTGVGGGRGCILGGIFREKIPNDFQNKAGNQPLFGKSKKNNPIWWVSVSLNLVSFLKCVSNEALNTEH